MKIFQFILLSITYLILLCGESVAKPQESPRLVDQVYFDEKTEKYNAELESTCAVRMKTDMEEEGDAIDICKYRNNYREAIKNVAQYDESIDKCNTFLCTWFQNECYKYKKNPAENEANSEGKKTCSCLTNIWNQSNCTLAYIHAADNDVPEAGLGNRVSENEEQKTEDTLDALKELGNLSPDKYSAEQQKCFAEKKVLYQGACYRLHDKKACQQNEWLVLRKLASESDMIMPVCKRNRCKSNEVSMVPKNNIQIISF